MTPNTVLTRPIILPRIANRNFTTVALLATDLAALMLSVMISIALKAALQGNVEIASYLHLWPLLFVFTAVYASIGLYSGFGIGAPEELRRATIASTILFITLAATTVSLRGARAPFTWTLFLALALSIALVPLLRECVRQLYSRESWWGSPAVIFGAGPAGRSVVRALLADPGLGLKPVAVLDDLAAEDDSISGVPVLGPAELAPFVFRGQRPAYAVFAMPDIPQNQLMSMIERYGANFSHVLVIPDLEGFASLWVNSKSVGGMVGLELRQQVLLSDYAVMKRIVDLVLTVVGGIAILPVCAAIAAWIKIVSPGPALYSQMRIGQNGVRFRAWKFRSMVQDADSVLEESLAANPALREEWERDHKLKNDPRVTAPGAFLRRTSLDELPQLWNVLKGDMSLVGPRPIVEKEVVKYGTAFDMFTRVKGGITGLWQVSGRNDVSYDERVGLDLFYVRNWSVWLDCCILFRTIAVVLFRKGAY